MACCLEFVENGSLEDWLRRTAGGRAYDPSKKKKTTRKKEKSEQEELMPLSEVVFRGYDCAGEYDESIHTAEDKKQIADAINVIERFAQECTSDAWHTNSTPLASGAKCWSRYDPSSRSAQSYASIEVCASPAQVVAWDFDPRRGTSETYKGSETVSKDSMSRLSFMKVPSIIPGIVHDRESLTRTVIKKTSNSNFALVGYQVGDSKKPVAKGAKRIESHKCILLKEKEGSNGKVCEYSCMVTINPKLSGMGRLANSKVAQKSLGVVSNPMIRAKTEVERLLGEYEPVLEEDESGRQTLTWNGQLLHIATQCALGVQYLHHERYWAEEEVKEKGCVVPAGYRECIIHR